jgi:hypothetical protein
MHVVPAQQPPGHETASQMQAPPKQRLPAPHAAPAPHWQVPAAEQPSPVVGSQVTQLLPAVPQLAALAVTHAPFAQQPVGHDCALHTQAPATQAVPAPHAGPLPQVQVPATASQLSLVVALHVVHARPPAPQLATAGVLHAPLAQQPLGHDVALHAHAPAEHTVPAPQAAAAPQ